MRPIPLFLAAVLWAASAFAGPRDAQWKEVEDAMGKGLPKTAIEKLGPILDGAKAEKAWPEWVRALGMKVALEGNVEGNKPEEKIVRLQAEVGKAPPETQPLLEAVLAHWYWQYFQHNRWRFARRTQTAAAPGPDLQAWDLPRILAEIDQHFSAALAGREKLKATPVTAFDGLLAKGSLPDAYRPTLFDFLASEALRFWCAGEQGGAKAEDAFVLEADGPALAPAADFAKWKPESTDTDSPTLKAVRLYQELLQFHAKDEDRSAFADADLNRLDFVHNVAVGEDKEELYRDALQRFSEEWSKHEVSSRALAQWGQSLLGENEPAEAHALAKRGLEAFPKSLGGTLCYNLMAQVQAKSAFVQTERAWNAPWPTVDVTYRNVTKVYFRAVPRDFGQHVASQRWGTFNFDDKFRKALLAEKPALAWEADLPPTADYRERTEKVPAPRTLKPGFYFIIASHDPSFGESQNQVSVAPVWVTDLAVVLRQRSPEGVVEGFVLKGLSGEPVAGAKVRCLARDREGWFKPAGETASDENGFFRFPGAQRNAYLLLAESGGQAFATSREWSTYVNSETKSGEQTVLFTDRALYRPGQAVSYKGICLRYDRAKAEYATLANHPVTVVFYDPNRKEVARAEHRSNDYGSFSGSFTAPRDRVMGQMRIEGPYGTAWFSVEEYKRPKFRVEMERPKEAAKLDAEVAVTGKATAYTGAPIGGAKVKWRVVRETRFPGWFCWCGFGFGFPQNASQAIAHGSAVTEADGAFAVKFVARPDRAVPEASEPIFTYTVHADVTDSTGETRSASRGVRAAYTALQASLAADEWQTSGKPVELAVSTRSLDDEPQAANGKVTVWRLKQPPEVLRPDLQPSPYRWNARRGRALPPPKPDASDPNTWETAGEVFQKGFATDKGGAAKLSVDLKPGIYRATLETKDRFGKAVTARLPLLVVDPKAKKFPVKVANRLLAPKWSLEPGEAFTALWGTGYGEGRAFVEIERDGQRLRAQWTAPGRTQEVVEQAVGEADRGGFTLRVTQVRENRAYFHERVVSVPWSNKQLALKWEHFTSKLGPAQKETWTAVIAGADAKRTAAEMAATLYDASLDAYRPHGWPGAFGVFRQEFGGRAMVEFQNLAVPFQHVMGYWSSDSRGYGPPYRSFPPELVANLWGYGFFEGGARRRGMSYGLAVAMVADEAVNAPASAPMEPAKSLANLAERKEKRLDAQSLDFLGKDKLDSSGGRAERLGDAGGSGPDLDKVAARKNLNETAFFLPHLLADKEGVVRMEFAMPEALTEWRFLGFAHTPDLCAGLLTNTTVTAKDLMVEPNPPRFLREGDTIEFTVKVTNPTDAPQKGKVRLSFSDARTLKPVDAELGNAATEQAFEVPGKQSRGYSWRITVPDGMGFLTYKAVAASEKLSDGEEGNLPVLSRRILVTESLPLPIRGKQAKNFEFRKLLESGKSDTLRHRSLTVQMVSQPAWYAVMALPYLMEYPYECSEQTFNRLYANSLARHVAASDPKIRRIFDLWKGTPALDSPLEKNPELKSVMLEETPWLRQAHKESEARRNVGLLFDGNRLDSEQARAFQKLAEAQLSEGMWPWFPGGRPSEFITLYIATGFGRLRHLGASADVSLAIKSLGALDAWMDENYRRILKGPNPELYVPSPTDALYLYGRSFFLKDRPIAEAHFHATDFFLGQSRKFWLKVDSRMAQAQLAIALKRFGNLSHVSGLTVAQDIMKSIKERSVSHEEMGMFWRDLERSWWWFRAPIETQAMMVEAFAEVAKDDQAVEDCKVWLLKQKQTQDWKTTKATADAVYALLLRGTSLLSSDALVEVSLAGQAIQPEKVEAGTGFYEKRFGPGEIAPAMGKVTVKKSDEGVSWGGVHWQYLEDVAKVTPHEGTPLKLKKAIFLREATKKGQALKLVAGPLQPGDEVVVRIELRTDRDMEYVHLKDQRGSGTEPVNVLSRTRFQDGLAYYETTRDTASHFFIEYLPKGVYVFEYPVRIQQRGRYPTGIAEIQCMYAPEFNSHSESLELQVK
jgi:hypothetical protein